MDFQICVYQVTYMCAHMHMCVFVCVYVACTHIYIRTWQVTSVEVRG